MTHDVRALPRRERAELGAARHASFLIMLGFLENTLIKAVLCFCFFFERGGTKMVMSKFRECQVWHRSSLIRLPGIRMREGEVHASLWGVGGVNF